MTITTPLGTVVITRRPKAPRTAISIASTHPHLSRSSLASPRAISECDIRSPAWLHKLVCKRARYLQRQEHYDFPQWDEDYGLRDDELEKDIHALLLIESPHVIVGAAGFSWILRWTSIRPPSWRMNFTWVAGTWRRKSVLSRRWPSCLKRRNAVERSHGGFPSCKGHP